MYPEEKIRELDLLKETIRTLRKEHDLSHIRPSLYDNAPSLRGELCSLHEAIGQTDHLVQNYSSLVSNRTGKNRAPATRTVQSEHPELEEHTWPLACLACVSRWPLVLTSGVCFNLHRHWYAEYHLLCYYGAHDKAENERQEQDQQQEVSRLKTRIEDTRSKHELLHIRRSLSDDVPSLRAELALLVDAVGMLMNLFDWVWAWHLLLIHNSSRAGAEAAGDRDGCTEEGKPNLVRNIERLRHLESISHSNRRGSSHRCHGSCCSYSCTGRYYACAVWYCCHRMWHRCSRSPLEQCSGSSRTREQTRNSADWKQLSPVYCWVSWWLILVSCSGCVYFVLLCWMTSSLTKLLLSFYFAMFRQVIWVCSNWTTHFITKPHSYPTLWQWMEQHLAHGTGPYEPTPFNPVVNPWLWG